MCDNSDNNDKNHDNNSKTDDNPDVPVDISDKTIHVIANGTFAMVYSNAACKLPDFAMMRPNAWRSSLSRDTAIGIAFF